MSKIPIVFTFDNRIILGAAAAIKSLIDSAKADTIYDIHILHNGIKEKYQGAFHKLTGNKHSLTFHHISKKVFTGVKTNNKSWTEIVYYRMIIPEILGEYDKVIYSDVDVFFKEDLTELYNTNIEGYDWGGVRAETNSPEAVGHKYFEENKNDYIFWSGLMLINCKKMRKEKTFQKLLNTALEFKNRLRFYDLDVLNIACDKILPLPLKYCVLEALYEAPDFRDENDYGFLKKVYTEEEVLGAISHPAIIHYAGRLGKPWRRKRMPVYYNRTVKELPKELVKYSIRDLRKKVFSKEPLFLIYKEDNHINFNILGLRIKFQNPFINQLEDCCSIHNLRELKKLGTIFPHPIGIVIAKDVKIGKNCVIYQNVTIGKKNGLTKQEAPRIGNNVKIYAGAVIAGNITIGDNCIIGANSMVLKSIPPNSKVVGNEIKVINATELALCCRGK